jgi:hypothetical protein
MRQMLDRVHAQVKQFSGLAAEAATKFLLTLRHELNAVVPRSFLLFGCSR